MVTFAGALKASFWFVSGLCALAAVLLAVAAARGGMAFWFERLVLTVSFSFFILDRLGSVFELHSLFDANLPLTLPWSPIVGVPLGLSMILSLARQASEARRTVVQSNETLAAELVQQNAKLEAAGIGLDFFAEVDAGLDLGPRPTLQVLRILQEAVTNAMRHSGARRITVKSLAPAGGPIRIAIGDDGTGLPEGYRRGRGLTSMETRARNLGGALTIDSGPDGTRLSLEVPVSATASAD